MQYYFVDANMRILLHASVGVLPVQFSRFRALTSFRMTHIFFRQIGRESKQIAGPPHSWLYMDALLVLRIFEIKATVSTKIPLNVCDYGTNVYKRHIEQEKNRKHETKPKQSKAKQSKKNNTQQNNANDSAKVHW